MTNKIVLIVLVSFSCNVMSADSFYCQQNQAYINLGMTMDQVIAACGQPLSHEDSNQPVMQRIPVQQLIYNNQGISTASSTMWNIPTGTAFYGVWNIPTGTTGTQLQIDVVNNKVKGVRVNGSDTNAFSICNGNFIQIGDQVNRVYGACGSPDVVNNTYYNQIVPTAQKPQVWIYQPGQYQPPVSLTFVNGKLQSINN